jgi:hypothetical protein
MSMVESTFKDTSNQTGEYMMKNAKLTQWLPSVIVGCVLVASATDSLAQAWTNPKTFDATKGSWITWNGWGIQDDGSLLTQDPMIDALNDSNSGSLRYAVPFTGDSGDQVMTFGTLHDQWGWDNTTVINVIGNYKNLTLDFLLDPTTAPTKNGNFGTLQIGLVSSDWKTIKLGDYPIPDTATSWTHIVMPIDQTLANLEKVTGYYIYMWSGGDYTSPLMFNVDNIYLEPSTNEPPPAPPTLAQAKAVSGLNLIAAGTGPWDRQNVRTVNPVYSWIGKGSSPVSYAFTVKSYPGTNNAGFELHNYLVPAQYDPATGTATIGAGASPDWDQATCIFMDLQNQADGSATWTFRWKTNTPGSNGTYFSDVLGTLNEPAGILGTWTLTFVNDTSVLMTSPSGLTAEFEFSADKTSAFMDSQGAALPLYYYVGVKPNDHPENFGLGAIVSNAKIAGVSAPIDTDFSKAASLDTNVWEFSVNNAGAAQPVPADALFWLNWTLPDAGFVLQGSSVMASSGWSDLNIAPLQTGLKKSVLITTGTMPAASQGYFRMIKRAYAKLQVLMPGETSAPGTATGKTGKPDPQTVSVPFNVTVNAVDDTWHVITMAANDEIALTSSDDASGNVTLPANGNLVGGSRTFSVTVNAEGSFTFTATDATDTSKTANTGSAVTLVP